MKGKLVPMIGLAVVFGGISIFAADRWVKSRAVEAPVAVAEPMPAAPAIATTRIVVAKSELKYGMALTADVLQEVEWPEGAVPQGAFTSMSDLVGDGKRTVVSAFAVNEPILPGKISGKDGRAALSNLLAPGMRAVTVRVDDITGVAGFVTAGDRVDVVLTRNKVQQQLPSAGGDQPAATSEMASEVILQNVKVLTLDQNADESNTTAQVAKAITVEVSTDDAQKVALAQQLGTLYLLLRPAGEATATNAASFSASNLDGKNANSEMTSALPVAEQPSQLTSPSIVSLEPEGPRYRSLTVTRGHTSETYSVIDENGVIVPAQAATNP